MLAWVFGALMLIEGAPQVAITGNTSGTLATLAAGPVVLAGGNNITLSQSQNTITVSAFTQSVQTQMTALTAGMSTQGNTSGTTGLVSNQLILVGGDNVTLSQSVNGQSAMLTIRAAAGGAAGSNTLGMSNLGNTAGTSGVVSGSAIRYLVAGGAGIIGSQSLDAGNVSGTFSLVNSWSTVTTASSVATANAIGANAGRFALEGHQHGGIPTVSVVGNTAGNTTQGNLSLILAGGPNITLSGATAAGAMTVSVSAGAGGGAPTLNFYRNWDGENFGAVGQGTTNATLMLSPLAFRVFPGNMTVSTWLCEMSGNLTATASSSSHTYTLSLGLYTLVNSTQLSLLNSVSTTWGTGAGNKSVSASYHGPRFLSIHSSQWSAAPTLSQTHYWLGVWMQSSNLAVPMSNLIYKALISNSSQQMSGSIGVSAATDTTQVQWPFAGIYSVSFTTAMPDSIGASQISGGGRGIPILQLHNSIGSF